MPKIEPVQLSIIVDDSGVKVLKDTEKQLGKTGKKAQTTGDKMKGAFKGAITKAKALKKAVFGIQGAIAALGAALAVGALVKFAKALIGPVAQVEKMTVGFKVLTGSARIAKARLAELTQFAASTPFELPQVFNAARIMRVFGLDTSANMRLLGDAAAAVQVPIEELAVWFGRLSSGDFGEALMRFREMGLATKKDFEAHGLTFNKSGSLVATASQAMNALGNIVNRKFGGMMDEQSRTIDGMISNFNDFVFQAKVILGTPLARIFKGTLDTILEQLNRLKESGKLEEWGEQIGKGGEGLLMGMAHVADFMVNEVWPRMQQLWGWFKELPGKVQGLSWQETGKSIGEGIADGIKSSLKVDWVGMTLPGWLMQQFGGGGMPGQGAGSGMSGVANSDPLVRELVNKRAGQGPTAKTVAQGTQAGVEAALGGNTGSDRVDIVGAALRILSGDNGALAGDSADGTGVVTTGGQTDLLADKLKARTFRAFGTFYNPEAETPQNLGMRPGGKPKFGGARGFSFDTGAQDEQDQSDRQERHEEAVAAWKNTWLDGLTGVRAAVLDFTLGLADVWADWWVGLADSSMSGSERLAAVWQNLKRLALSSIADQVTAWVKGNILKAASDKAYAAAHGTAAAQTVVQSQAVQGQKQAEAVATIGANQAKLGPFAILAMGAMVGFYLSQVSKSRSGGKSTGGAILGMGSASTDDNLTPTSRGEFVVNASASRRLGRANLDALNRGELPGGGGMVLSPVFNFHGNDVQGTKRYVEEELLPALEQLVEENRTNLNMELRT